VNSPLLPLVQKPPSRQIEACGLCSFHSFYSLVVRLIGLTRNNNVFLNNTGSLNGLPPENQSQQAPVGSLAHSEQRNLLPMLGGETLLEVVGDNSCESTRMGIDGSSERDFTIKLFALNSKRSY
jgi:hypothetical protein